MQIASRTLLLLSLTCFLLITSPPAEASASQRTSTIAVVLLGSLEFQQPDYYTLAAENLTPSFPSDSFRLFVGDYSQTLFERYCDKKGLLPGEIPDEAKLIEFAWLHSFDKVIFLMMKTPVVTAEELPLHWENSRATLTVRAISVESRSKKKTADAKTTQSVEDIARGPAKRSVFQKCLENIRGQLR